MVKSIGKYELHGTLGEGSFGKVKYAVNKETDQAVAIKILDKEMLRKKNMSVQIKREISLMRVIHHKHVIAIYDVFATATKIFMVLELVEGGELFDMVVDKGKFSEPQARFYMRQLIDGMECCHSQGICHRDLKPENILLDAQGNLKISDFGMARLYIGDPDASGEVRAELLHTTCGTPNYVAPEVLTCQGYDGQKADVWSMGVILFVLLAGYLPFEESTTAALFKKIKSAEFVYPKFFSPLSQDVLSKILVVDPEVRLSLAEFKTHPWTVLDAVEVPEVPKVERKEFKKARGSGSKGKGKDDADDGDGECVDDDDEGGSAGASHAPPLPPPPPSSGGDPKRDGARDTHSPPAAASTTTSVQNPSLGLPSQSNGHTTHPETTSAFNPRHPPATDADSRRGSQSGSRTTATDTSPPAQSIFDCILCNAFAPFVPARPRGASTTPPATNAEESSERRSA